jgi:hypothetical protein
MEDGTFDLFGIPVERADAEAILSAVAELPLAEWWQGIQSMAAHGGHEAADVIALVRDTLPAGEVAPALVVLDTEGDWDDQGDAYRASTYRATLVRVLNGPTRRYATRDALAGIQAGIAGIPSNAVVGIGSHVDSLVHETLGARLERAGQDQRAWTLVTGRN